jgi:opacity protein-like surface antigen
MGRLFKTIALIGPLALTLGTAAMAADAPRSPMSLPPRLVQSPLLVDEFASGWYLRGDIGYRINEVGSVSNVVPVRTIDDQLDKSFMFGTGVGYQHQWLRTDVTIDYGKAKYAGSTASNVNHFSAKIESVTVLANLYGDLGTWSGLTPYVGVGAGGAYVWTSDFELPFRAPTDLVGPKSKTNFVWAWMAGVSYKISENYHLDLGYRHIRFGDAHTKMNEFDDQLRFKRLSADEFRVGFRYLID